MRYDVEVNGRRRQVEVHRAAGRFQMSVGGRSWDVDASRVDAHTLSLLMTPVPVGSTAAWPASGFSASHEVTFAADAGSGALTAYVSGLPVSVVLNGRQRRGAGEEGHHGGGPQRVVAPMPGKVVRVLVRSGDVVRARQGLVVVEAMKMENELKSGRDGRVADVAVRDGQSVEAGALLVVIADE